MHTCFKFSSVVFLVLVSILQACGGGSSNHPPTQASVVTSGVVTGFGSVVVDDNEIEDAKASVVTENADGTYSNTVLQLGQRIKVDHDGKGTANKVTVDATLIGVISAVSTTDLTLKVAGQVVSVNSDISKGPLTIWAGGYNSIADLAVNQLTQIHGSLVYDNVSKAYKVTATRIQKMAALTSLKVSGKIADINTTAKTFKLNDLTIAYANAIARPSGTNLSNGLMVTVFGPASSLSGNTTLNAEYLKINRLQDAASQDNVVQISGQLSMYETASKTFELLGMKVVFADSTKITPNAEAISNSAYVSVSGSVNAEGVIQASAILVRQQSNSSDLAKVKLIGPISQFVDSSHFVVRGIPVDAGLINMNNACPDITLADDVPVQIFAIQQANTPVVLATRMECKSMPALAMRTLFGTVNNVDTNANQFVVTKEGVPAGSKPVLQQVLWNDKTTFMGITSNELKTSGLTIRVEGYMEAGVLIARVVSKGGAGLDDDKFLKPAQGNSSGWSDYQKNKQSEQWGTGQTLTLQFNELASAAYESNRLLNTPTPDFQVTGLYAPPGAVLTVNVSGTAAANNQLRLLVGTFSRYNNGGRDPTPYTLKAGNNVFVVGNFGGLVYIQYTVNGKPDPNNLHPLTIDFQQGFLKTPHYVLGKTNKADWKKQLSTYTSTPDVVMESKRAFMVFSRENALAWQDNDQELVLNTADQILDAEDSISGLDGSSETHRRNTNQFLMTQAEDGWMYATNFRTAFSAGAAKYAFTPLITGRLPNSGDAWGIWHELGHLHQQPWTWSGLGEVTVNIYSMAAERSLQVTPDRLTQNDVKTKAMAYLAAADANKNFNADSVDVWIRLCMFHQLWLAYGDSFYQQLHKLTREEKPVFKDDAARMRYFMLKACQISGHDLTAFFKKWGLQADSVYAEIAALHLSPPPTDPSTRLD